MILSSSIIVAEVELSMPGPVGSLSAYIQAVNAIPPLTLEQERELAFKLTQQGDVEAAKQLVAAHLQFVVRIAQGFDGYHLNLDDLIQEGNIGLMKAVKRFDPNQQVRFVSFAVHSIRAEMQEFILRNWRIAKMATTKAQRKLFFNLRRSKTHLGWFTNQEVSMVAQELGVKPETVLEMETRFENPDVSFDPHLEEVDHLDDEERTTAPVHYLSSQYSDPAELLECGSMQRFGLDALASALNKLDARSRDIVEQRWLQEKKSSLKQLAKTYQVSIERIRQLEQQALSRLRQWINHYNLY